MKAHKKIIIIFFSVIILIFISAVVIISIKNHRKFIRECYKKQNNAFLITDGYDYFPWDKEKNEFQYYSYDNIRSKSRLYSWLLYYQHETGEVLTVEDIEKYLSQLRNKKNNIKTYNDNPKIQKYVDYMYDINNKNIKPSCPIFNYDDKMCNLIYKKTNIVYSYYASEVPFSDIKEASLKVLDSISD